MQDPKMPELRGPDDVVISKESVINAPIDIVFDVITDFQLFVELEEKVESVTITSDITEGMGVRSRWVLTEAGTDARWELDEEVIRFRRPFQYAYVGYAGGKDYSGVHTLEELPDGTTYHVFNEAFYFDVNVAEYDRIVGGMVANVKRVAEERAGSR